MLQFLSWMLTLVVQNMSFTWVSRARNSGSDLYHGIAAVFSNGVWFLAFYTTFDYLDKIHETGSVSLGLLVAAAYISSTVTGSVFGGKLVRRFFERGNRRVGHYDANEARLKAIEAQLALLDDYSLRRDDEIARAPYLQEAGDTYRDYDREPL